jgi:hypothetical protein
MRAVDHEDTAAVGRSPQDNRRNQITLKKTLHKFGDLVWGPICRFPLEIWFPQNLVRQAIGRQMSNLECRTQ